MPVEQENSCVPISWVLCAVFGVLMMIFALRPPACKRMMMQMQAMAAQAGGKMQQTIKETEMKLREKQKQKQADDERLRQEQHIFGPLEKIKAAIRTRRQRKVQQCMALLAAPQADDFADAEADEQETPDGSAGGSVQYDSIDDDVEYPGLSG